MFVCDDGQMRGREQMHGVLCAETPVLEMVTILCRKIAVKTHCA